GDFEQKLNTAETPDTRTKATVQTKNDARKSTEKSVRLFIKRFLNNNPQVSKADRDSFGRALHRCTLWTAGSLRPLAAGIPPRAARTEVRAAACFRPAGAALY
ncbi:MAG: hypothetical protein LBN98_04945, partial [Prevotellaceae bacterium]|nr:hypothetical protein [Prevotellaceae bacterium]